MMVKRLQKGDCMRSLLDYDRKVEVCRLYEIVDE